MNEDFIPVKRSQISLFKNFPLFYFSKENEPLLYKKEGELLKAPRIKEEQFPDLFIRTSDREGASSALYKTMNAHLTETIFSQGIVPTRQALSTLVQEALEGPLNISGKMLPETIEILFQGYNQNKTLVEALAKLSSSSDQLVEHTVNILSLSMQFCTFHHYTEAKAKTLGVSAILHDIGCTELPPEILNTNAKLSDAQFKEFQSHTVKGYRTIKDSACFKPEIALVALEHHERLDGSGYPKGNTEISEDAQLIGLINSYEPLTYRGTSHHGEPQKPYNSLQILKNEVMAGQYNRQMFVNFCSCLTQ
ncbi:diguanylate cyclase [Desulfobacter hydrogenophilus]|uniref:Diguanylate cyclase n=1 Tax=Desulfobacter hydrogenophilus TaxID=2291 RepID=A0A328FET7_9BACT|nr:HD domain-containing phosphohydrolase [Desulfobacter hydrogenophilus]NDY70798.1 HD domain-containing protein [Desulfobacter hydrogenophilus]QBH11570.1 HD domain-containing protein [Desulfobacter hydrogenophilus]RAM03118.1 diguanylate cyclase [Desulfobacter hydrogenophilus]